MEKVLHIPNMAGSSIIRVFSKDYSVDFSKGSTMVLVYLDEIKNMTKPDMTFHAERLIQNNKQPQTTVFDINIPNGVKAVTLIMSTKTVGFSIEDVKAEVV